LSVWLYGKGGRFEEFSTNPLPLGPRLGGEAPEACVARGPVRHAFSDFVRCFTTRLPMRGSYALSYVLAALGAFPGLKYLTFSVHPGFKVRVIENFDWISPPFQYHHTKEELVSWFEAAGYEVLRILPHGLVPKPGVLGRRREDAR